MVLGGGRWIRLGSSCLSLIELVLVVPGCVWLFWVVLDCVGLFWL